DYGHWNGLGLSHHELVAKADAAERGEATGALTAGWSTGTGGGARGLFVAGEAERADYIGQSLARLLPRHELLRRQRIALHLRASSALYSDVRGRRIGFAHFPLGSAADDAAKALARYNPTVLIAPPHRLIAFAKAGLALPSLRHLFFGSEPVSEQESAFVARYFGLRPRAIYQATEGFLGAQCVAGRLHLNEHALRCEFQPVDGTTGEQLIVTDLHRRSQPIIRVRLDDFIEHPPAPDCPCGYAGTVIRPPAGRVQDLWRYVDKIVTPRAVTDAVEIPLGGAVAWQAEAGSAKVALRIAPEAPANAVAKAVTRLAKLVPVPIEHIAVAPDWSAPKRRKVAWSDD
ncbi:MAG: hypothetical protein WBA68_12215, partial [Alteraurantiacibacter sp.]